MKKKLMSLVLAAVLAAGMMAGCGEEKKEPVTDKPAIESGLEAASEAGSENSAPKEEPKKIALVTKSAGNAFMELLADGVKEAVEDEGGTFVVKDPSEATAEAQSEEISALVKEGVDAIIVTADGTDGLTDALKEARDAGISVLTADSDANAADRSVFVNQADATLIGQTLLDAAYDLSGGSGQYAILSTTSQAANQNAWIDAMKAAQKADPKYEQMELAEIAFGDDDPQKSTERAEDLLKYYPDLKVIVAPTTVGILAAAKVLKEQGSAVRLTGLGLPSEMQEYMGNDEAHCCPYMYLWNMTDLGRLTGFTAMALVNGKITGEAGEKVEAGDLGEFEIKDVDGATQIVLGPPFQFTPENVKEWADKGM